MNQLTPLLQHYGLAVVFICVLVEQAGLPIPAVPVLLVAGALVQYGDFSILQILAVATLASLIADIAWLRAGDRYGRRILGALCKLSLSPDSCVRRTDAIYVRFGARSLAFAKFVPGYATLGPALAGIAGTSVATFLLWDGIGTLLWAGSAILVGHLFSTAVDDVITTLTQLGKWGSLILLGALALFIGYKWWWRRHFIRQLRMDRITVEELRQLFVQGLAPIVLDVRKNDAELQAGMIPGAIALHSMQLEELIPTLLNGATEAILYCSCPNEVSAAMIALQLKRRGVRKVRPLLGGLDAWSAAGYALTTRSTDAQSNPAMPA